MSDDMKKNQLSEEECDKIVKEINKKTDDLEIPEELNPENMMKKIKTVKSENKKKKKSIRRRIFISICSTAVAALAAISVYKFATDRDKTDSKTGTIDVLENFVDEIKEHVTQEITDNDNSNINNNKNNDKNNDGNDDKDYRLSEKDYKEFMEKYNSGVNVLLSRDDFNIILTNNESNSIKYLSMEENAGEGITNDIEFSNEMASPETDHESSEDKNSVSGDYKDTNNIVEGVAEADSVKTDGKYIYTYSNDNRINITEANGGNVKYIGSIDVEKDILDKFKDYNYLERVEGFYVCEDRLVIVANIFDNQYYYEYIDDDYIEYEDIEALEENNGESLSEPIEMVDCIAPRTGLSVVVEYDLKNITKPEICALHKQNGMVETSRLVDGILYLITNKEMYINGNEEKIYPSVDDKELECDEIFVVDGGDEMYKLITSYDVKKDCEVIDKKCLTLSYGSIYMNENNIYINSCETVELDEDEDNNRDTSGDNSIDYVNSCKDITKITKVSYDKGKMEVFEKQAAIDGSISNEYGLYEKDGYLRAVVEYQEYGRNGFKVYTNVYVLDEKLNKTGEITGLAEDERIYSVRYIGDYGYFVTYRNMDPLFAVNFKNPEKPEIMSELHISGFSSYLQQYGKNKLLGIGYETDAETSETLGLKMSMFDIKDISSVSEENRLVIKPENNAEQDIYINDYYKAIMASSEKGIIGFAYSIYDYSGGISSDEFKYAVYGYDKNKGFVKKLEYTFEQNENNIEYYGPELRGIYIDDVFYVIDLNSKIAAFDMKDSFNEISEIYFE